MEKNQSFLPVIQHYFESDLVHAAQFLETMDPEEAASVIAEISPSLQNQVFLELQDTFAAQVMNTMSQDDSYRILESLDHQRSANILRCLKEDKRNLFIQKFPEVIRRKILEFLIYPLQSAGQMMTGDFLAFHSEIKVQDAVQKIRETVRKGQQTSYIYVVDRENHLAGVMNMRDMLLAIPEATLESIMRKNVFAVDAFLDREAVAAELSKRKYFSAPVVDSEFRLLGVIKAEQMIGGVQEEATEDMQKLFGAGGDERAFSSIGFSLAKRLPWLHINLATAFLAAWVVSRFEDIIAKITVLAVYLPVVAGQGGNAGAQSLAVVIRAIVLREIPKRKIGRLILKESVIGFVNGVVIGIVTALLAWIWHGNPYLGLVVALAMMVNLLIAGLAGAGIPLAMKAIGLDPAQCSNIILTTITDCMGFFSFLGFAVIFQRFLK